MTYHTTNLITFASKVADVLFNQGIVQVANFTIQNGKQMVT